MSDSLDQHYYRQLCDNLGVAVVATDLEKRIRTWNAAATRLFGAAADAMLGSPFREVFPHQYRDEAERRFERTLTLGDIVSFEFSYPDARGASRDLIATFAPIVTDAGKTIGASASVRDITQRIRLQRERDENLQMAALGTLASNVAHHFNNILGGVIMASDFALSSNDPARMRTALRQASDALVRALRLLGGLLMFSDGGEQAGDLSDVTELLTLIADETDRDTRDKSIRMKVDIERLGIVSVPRAQFMAILRHVIRNAVEAMPDGGDLSISLGRSGKRIVITVGDTGPGMSKEALRHMFEPFWSTKRTDDGGDVVGLGLAVTKGLVEFLGGDIEIESKPGEGTTARIFLPYANQS